MPDTLLRLFLVRHGITDWNRVMRFQGHTDIPLDEEGEAQARLIAARLARLSSPLDAIYSSDLLRAVQTASAIAEPHGLKVHILPSLRETGLGSWEGLTHDDIVARGEGDHLERYRRDSFKHRPPGGESLEAAWERMLAALDGIRAAHPNGGQVAIVGHGGSLRVLLCHAVDAPITSISRFRLGNTALSIIEEHHQDGHVFRRIALMNDTSHLQTL